MSAPLLQFPDQVERKVASLAGSGFGPAVLTRACQATLAAQLPLRDAIVLREAKRLNEALSPELLRAWVCTRRGLRRSVPPSTYRIWFKPLRPVEATGATVVLTAPEHRIVAWAERRYSGLIVEALTACSNFNSVSFVSLEGPVTA